MNTTFTNCAEKKAKQFFNLLQGYTKGIRMTAILILLLMGVSNASAVDLYLRGIVSWDCWNDNHLVDRGNNIQSTYVSLEANTDYTFKVGDSNWSDNYNYGKNGNNTLSLGHEYKMAQKGGDLSFKPTETGVYLFSVNTSSWGLTITRVIPTAAAPAKVVNGTNKMFYIEGHAGLNYLLNSSKGKASTSYPLSYMGTSYVNTAATNLTQYYYISNNPNGWVGETNNNIKSAKGGELFSHTSKTAAKTASTTPSISGNTLNISTTTNATTGVYGSLKLYIQYYINNNFTGVTYNSSTASYASISANGATARKSTLDISDYATGTYTLKTVLTDGIIYYVADTDDFEITNTRTITFGVQDGGGKVIATVDEVETTASPISVEDGTQIKFTATADANNVFSKWVNGSGTQISTQNPYTHTVSSDATIKAVFLKPTTIYLKPSSVWKQANARFAIYAFGGGSGDKWVDMTPVGCNDEYYMADVPAGYSQFKFVRLNPATTENNWDNRWAETGDLTIPNNENNLFDMTQIYLEVNNWDVNDANERYAAYFYVKDGGDKVKWMSMSHVKDDIYKCDIPSEHNFDWVIFGRMDGNNSTNAFDNGSVWNQTSDLEITSNHYTHGNYFTITKFENGNTEGSWSWNDIAWTKLDLPKITITNSNPTYGDITVTTVGGTTITSEMEVDWDTQVIVSVQPKAGYAVKSSSINIGGNAETIQSGKTYTICNSTTISVSFEEKGEWYIAGIDGNWEVREEYKFIDDRILIELDGKETKEFKVVKKTGDATEWYGNYTFKGLYPSGVLNTNSGDYNSNCKVETVHDGDYLFIWNADEKRLTIEYPDVIFLHGSFNGWKDKASHALHNQDAKVYLTSNTTYEFKVAEKGVYWTSNAYETLITNSGTKNIDDNTAYDTDPRHNCQIKATITGLYTFHFDKETRVLTVTYPEDNSLKAGDYRLYYTETAKNHASDYVKQRATDGRDTVSLFINKDGSSPKVTLQKYNGSSWVDVNAEEVYNVSDINAIANDEHMYQGNGVWNFIITQVNGVAKVAINETHRYTGNYYIRTEVADGGWYEYKIPENQMFFSSYARDHENFDHYFCKYIDIDKSSKDVRFNVANDYCSQLCPNNFNNDDLVSGDMPASGNVRFMYFSKTNTLGRAYLDGSSTDNFLRITDATTLYDADGKNSITTAKFTDLQNWIYQVDVQATSSTQIKLRAIYNGNEQYFKGSATEKYSLLNSTNDDKHKIRLIYNFKTNHLVCAWLAAGETIDGENQTLGADMMLIRENQDPADQLYFNPNYNTLSEVKNAYAVMTFTEDFIKNEEKTIYERALYWVSFPYDVLISQVFGFGEYGEHWIMQYYDGAARAEKGLFSDSGTYWKYITDTRTILEKGKGYVLTLDLDKVKTSFIHGIESVSLYFPSDGELGTIQGDDPTAVNVPEHECNINFSNDPNGTNKDKRDRRIYDSHWNMIGVPRFADISDFDTDNDLAPVTYSADSLSFYYEYLPKTDKYQTRIVTADFQAMYGYMVQFAGTINWTEKEAIKPAQLAARRNADNTEPEKVSLRLEIAQDEEMADQTFVQLQQEGATAEFDMNLDLTKIINSGANIYTLAGEQRIQSAGNALPMGEAIVPVGVQIAAEGEYTFRMPDGTEGMVVELVDYENNTRTNLLLSDYTVTLPKGSCENRFALHIQPQKDVVTSLENIGEGVNNGEAVNKYLIDGKLIIRTAEGVVYDAQGKLVR